MSDIRSYRDLQAWQLAVEAVEHTYRLTGTFPSNERFGLSQQMHRAAVSVPANIAEGHARRSLRSYLNHISIALGSLGELDTELEIAERLRYVSSASSRDLHEKVDRTRQVLHGLRRSLEVRLFASLGTGVVCLAGGLCVLINW